MANVRKAAPIAGVAVTSTARPPRPGSIFQETGTSGLRHYSGRLYEEFLPELAGPKGIRVYTEMSSNDAIVGSTLYAVETLMRRAAWRVDPASDSDPADIEAAQFVTDCMHDMELSWADTIGEILFYLRYGWGYHEEVFKIRRGVNRNPRLTSKHDDGLIGWRKLPSRAQETLYRWELDEEDGYIEGMWQQPPPLYQLRYVDDIRALHFRTSVYKNNPEGRSMLRIAYRPWYFKRRLEEIEAIGLERDLAGMPVLQPPLELDLFNENDPDMVDALARATDMVTNIRRDEIEGVVLPSGWMLTLLSAGGSHGGASKPGKGGTDIAMTIKRYDQHIAMSMLADFIMLGHMETGSYALSQDKTDMFNLATNSHLDYVASVFNTKAIPRLIRLNPRFPQDRFPTLAHDGVDTPNMVEIGTYLKDMTGIGILVPDPGLEDYVRSLANLPTRPVEETDEEWASRHAMVTEEDANAETERANRAEDSTKDANRDAKVTEQHAALDVKGAQIDAKVARLQAARKPAAKPAARK